MPRNLPKNLVSSEDNRTPFSTFIFGNFYLADTTGLDSKSSDDLITWLSATLSGRAAKVKVTRKLESHPCVVTVEEMGAARHFVRTQSQAVPEEQRYQLLQPQLEINPKYCIGIFH